jgi:hypothetical protein
MLLQRLGLHRAARTGPEDERLTPLAELLSRVSHLAHALRDDLVELDLNPVVWDLGTGQVVVADAVAVLAASNER